MAKGMNSWLGGILIAVGIIGFAFNGFLAMHLNPAHDVVLIVTGLIALYFGRLTASYRAARTWCIVAGLVYGIISVIGLFCGPGMTTVPPIHATHNLLVLSPGMLEFGSGDNWWQLLTGVLFLIGGFTKETTAAPASAYSTQREQQTINK